MSEKPLAQPAAESGRDAFENSPAVSTLLDPRSSPADPPTAEVGLARSFAATAVREVLAAAERAAPTGRTHVDLRLQTFDDENIRVHLQWRDGVIQAKFVTETPELQQALSREWDAATPRFADQGLKFAAPTFERQGQEQSSHPQGSSAFAFDQQRHSRGRQLPDDAAPAFALPAFFAEARRGTDLPADLPALATQLQSGDVSNVRGLRTWA